MAKQTQKQKVIAQLKAEGFVTRNWCLANYISRLSALIQDLEQDGFVFTTYRDEGDYGYKVKEVATKLISKVVEREGKYYETRVPVSLF